MRGRVSDERLGGTALDPQVIALLDDDEAFARLVT